MGEKVVERVKLMSREKGETGKREKKEIDSLGGLEGVFEVVDCGRWIGISCLVNFVEF